MQLTTKAKMAVCVAAAAIGAFSAHARKVKVIAHGWECQSADPTDVLASAAEFDKTELDGVSLSLWFTNRRHGVQCSFKTMMTDPAWSWDDVKHWAPVLREIGTHKSLKESLLSSFRCPKKRLDWRDDAAWAVFANNMGVMARLAKEGNVKGIMIDPEDYPRTKQFYHLDGDADYDETVKLARRRGREVFSAVFKEKPDATVLAFWLLSTDKNAYNSHDPKGAMREIGCLFPAFMDGILDVIPPTALLVDGNENTYRAEAPYGDFFADAARQRRNALELISPENHVKYRAQHRVGAAFFLDGYWYPPENKWYMPPFNGTRADWLALNLSAAAEAADYIWLDGEWRTYLKWTKSDAKTDKHISDHFLVRPQWSEIIPGFWKAVKSAVEPLATEYGRRVKVAYQGPLTVKTPRSTMVNDVKYGEIYEVVGRPLTQNAFLRVDWKKENASKWAGRAQSVQIVDGRAVFRVPQGVDSFAVVYNPSRCKGGVADFTGMTVNRLELLSDEEQTLTAASDELYRYWHLITGKANSVPVRLRIDPSVSKSGNDAYSIVTEDGIAVISGSNARSVLYGVYDLLERRGGCGWFWDGDRIPKKKSISVAGLDVHEESKFEYRGIRYFAHRGLSRFQAEHWSFEDWKREIDWCMKKRLNLMMLRIGQDDLFQKAFSKSCSYPDATKALPGQGRRYDNRSLFWPLEFRGELRRKVMQYAFRRGMMAPSDFGTMTHWYSRTPQDFLDGMKPDFLPQAPGAYGEPSGLVWDIRKPKWMDAYWRITDADVREYGRPGLLHTIGIAERHVSTNRAENLALKTKLTRMLLSEAKRRYPDSKRLLAGWDLYCMKTPDEVKAFLKNIPEDVIIWDYEADASINTWFGEWDVVGKRPYVFGVFMAYEAGLDSRTDYSKLAARQKLIENDPMCKGYILWPESSHVDSIGIEWFAKNSWRADSPAVGPVVDGYCARRYPEDAKTMAELWMKTIPVSTNMQNVWRWNAFLPILREMGEGLVKKAERSRWAPPKPEGFFGDLPAVVETLKSLDWDKDELLRRDMIDIARVWADRIAIDAENAMFAEYFKWLEGDGRAKERFAALADVAYKRLDALATLISLHTDFSICDTYDRIAKAHPVAYAGFMSVLVDNTANYYCTSHQAELARHCYLPAFRSFTERLKAKMAAGDMTPLEKGVMEEFKDKAIAMSYSALELGAPRTREAFCRALDGVLEAYRVADAVR